MANVSETQFDVVVIGGGAAGIAAAIGAARAGASVCLVEKYGFLGGAATNSSVLALCGFFDQNKNQVVAGVGQHVLDQLRTRDIYQTQTVPETGNTIVLLDLETTKSVYDDLITAAGVRLLLHSQLISATVTDGRITAVDVVHRGGTETIIGRAFVDCSGDGALIDAAGAGAIVSAPAERQASTLVMRVGAVSEDADLSMAGMDRAVDAYRPRSEMALVRSTGTAVRMPLSREVMLLIADHHGDVLDVNDLTAAEVQSRRLSWQYLAAFQQSLAGWENSFLASTGPQLGIRETRRLRGRHAVSADDVADGRKSPADAIARGGWPMENHVAVGITEYGGIAGKGWYHVPYGAICSDTTENLWAGGRLVSSDNRAYASLRVMGTSFATGHACGVAAAVYAVARAHDYGRIRTLLNEQGALI
ncbi:FAD-dependent oxidoreductase [Cryobacterium serini]|uniref:FAD-dependent oxidoreductase n=1 Tax=Cryobacterium serini TaxID=1259201 RepID=UPI0018E07A25|nr:FAD-dependent oxidoreductase [Cryobacterium serini]